MSRLQRHPQRIQASSQQGQAITHQGLATIPQEQAISQQIPEVRATSHQDLARHQVQATFRLALGRNTLPALVGHQDLARLQVQATFRLALGRNTLPALVIHRYLARYRGQATFRLARARLQATPPVQVTCHQATPRAPALVPSHPELLSILPDQAISLVAPGLQGVAAVTEQACIHQGRARRHRMVQGGPSTLGQL